MSDRDYYQRNRERSLAASKAWKLANPERTKENQRRWREKNKDKIREKAKAAYRGDLPKSRESRRRSYEKTGRALYHTESRLILAKLHGAKRRAGKRGLAFDIAASDVHIPPVCPVFGVPLVVGGSRNNSPALDRIDNAKGYVRGNVAVISQRANVCKSDMSVDECRKLLAYMEAAELVS